MDCLDLMSDISIDVIEPENKFNNADTFTAIPNAARIKDRFSLLAVLLTLEAPVSSI